MVDPSTKHDGANRPIISQRRRQTWITTLLGAAILISGVGIGLGSAMTYLSSSQQQTTTADTTQQESETVAIRISNDMARKCELDEEQKAKVRELMTSRMKEIHEIRTKAMDEIAVIHGEITNSMKELMTPEQFQRWQKHNEEARKRSKYYRHHRDRHRGGPGRGKYGGSRGGPQGSSKYRPGGFDFFKRLDKDGDNVLSAEEIKAIPEKMRPFWQKADKNNDGKIERKELESMFRRRHPSSAPKSPSRKGHDHPEGKPKPPPAGPGPDMSMMLPL